MAAYVTHAQFAALLPTVAALTTASVFDGLAPLASRMVDRITGWPDDVFVLSAPKAVYVDGRHSWVLRLPEPPFAISKIERVSTRGAGSVSEAVSEVDPAQWIARTRNYPTDRALAKIETFRRGMLWSEGQENYKITGTFGYVDPAGATPTQVQIATGKLTMMLIEDDTDGGDGDAFRRGSIVEFQTDNFRYLVGGDMADVGQILIGTLTGRRDIDGILAMYRPAPKGGSSRLPRSTKRGGGGQVVGEFP